jgi:hypothetical protein
LQSLHLQPQSLSNADGAGAARADSTGEELANIRLSKREECNTVCTARASGAAHRRNTAQRGAAHAVSV